MIREVYINNQLIDIEASNVAGYIFTSPIFRDISKIISNRTTTYKIPKTTRNLTIFGLADNPDVNSLAPYREYTFKEYRDGLPFIDGVCHYLKTADRELELAVFWGNSEKLQKLKDINLRDLKGSDNPNIVTWLRWNANTKAMTFVSEDKQGFPLIDFGQGISDIRNIHPSVNIQYILDLITHNTGLRIKYPNDFKDEFAKKWFPLVEKNANYSTWKDEYIADVRFDGFVTPGPVANFSIFRFHLFSGSANVIEQDVYSLILGKNGSDVSVNWQYLRIKVPNLDGENTDKWRLKVYAYQNKKIYAEQYFPIYTNEEGEWQADAWLNMNFSLDHDIRIQLRASYERISDGYLSSMGDSKVTNLPMLSVIQVSYPEVHFGDRYPIIPNLPNMKVIDFLKAIMNMYGLFTYHNFKVDADTVQFVSIDDMYKDKPDASDWTHKLVTTNKGRMELEYTYGEYAQLNNMKYKNDKEVTLNADGNIAVDNHSLSKVKDIVEIPFSPSYNFINENGNTYARLESYDADGKFNKLGARILSEDIYKMPENNNDLKSCLFDKSLYFSGDLGLLKMHYSSYQHVLLHPIVATCYVYLNDVELHLFRENNPVYIDGVYYMPITVTVQTNGLAVCKLIKMPPI